MESNDKFELSLDELSLEPLEEQSAPPKTPAKFQIDTRSKAERRVRPDRRSTIRFQEDRRAGKDRRAGVTPWAPGTDI
ncbi:MAG: hypothetical protein ACRERY_17315 [Pseudomonas sp.]